MTGNLRGIKPLGTADMIVDRYDSIFRRNLMEPEAPADGDKKRVRKAKYKWHNKAGEYARKI